MNKLFTSEAVSIGHSDFIATSISDALLDYCMVKDKKTRAGIEVMCVPERVILGGEVTTKVDLTDEKVSEIVRSVVKFIGYTGYDYGFEAENLTVENYLHTQSPDINQGVDQENGEIGAGDQGLMFGFATNETKEAYPLAAQIANELMRQYTKVFKHNSEILSPDAKSQVTIDYTNNRIDTIVIAASHKEGVKYQILFDLIKQKVIDIALQHVYLKDGTQAFELMDANTKILLNTTGKFVICGPLGDCGICGRKLAVDSYGGYARLGGGNTHGKDASKSDFSFAVYSRYLAKNVVSAGLADKVEIQLASAIGMPYPVSIAVNTFGTGKLEDNVLAEHLLNLKHSNSDIINLLHLTDTNRFSTNTDYTFGVAPSEVEFEPLKYFHPWEKLNLVDTFKTWK